MTALDERKGLPSASEMSRVVNCPASRSRAIALNFAPVPDRDTSRQQGTDLHSAMAGELDDEDVEQDDLQTAIDICRHREENLLVQLGFKEPEIHIEERLWLTHKGAQIASGKPDKVFLENGRFLIVEYKLARKDQPRPSKNVQLIFQAILTAEHYGVTEGILAVIPAWRPMPPVAEITKAELEDWKQTILEAIGESEGPNPSAQAGPWCDHCDARFLCPEAISIVRQASELNPDSVMTDSPEQMVSNYEVVQHAKGTIKVWEEQTRARLQQDPASIPGLRITEGAKEKKFSKTVAFFTRLFSVYPLEAIAPALGVTPTSLAKVISPGKGQKAAKTTLEEEFSEHLIETQKSGSIERVTTL